jgi:hypothetical protein
MAHSGTKVAPIGGIHIHHVVPSSAEGGFGPFQTNVPKFRQHDLATLGFSFLLPFVFFDGFFLFPQPRRVQFTDIRIHVLPATNAVPFRVGNDPTEEEKEKEKEKEEEEEEEEEEEAM